MSHITLGSELKKTNGYNILPIFYSKIKSFLLSQCKSRGGFVNIKKKKSTKTKREKLQQWLETDKRKRMRKRRRWRRKKEEKRRRNSSRRWRCDTMIGDLCWQLAASTWPSPCCVVFFFSFYFYFYFFSLTNKKFMEWRGRWRRERWDYFSFGDLWVRFVLGVYCVWRNLWDEKEDDEEGDGELFWFWFRFVLICTVLVCVGLVI